MGVKNPLLPLFKEQLEAECMTIARDNALERRGDFLIYWYFTKIHNFTSVEVEDVFCDGFNDLGIDAIWLDDDLLVHFYQFKNPEKLTKGVAAGDIDKLISGLRLVINSNYASIANSNLKLKLQDIYQQLPTGYRIHIVSSGLGLPPEAEIKLNNLVSDLKNPSLDLIQWDQTPLEKLQELFYQQSLPAVKDPIRIKLKLTPYMLRSGIADCYLFSVDAEVLVELYRKYGEGLLQRNIRVDQGDTSTNRSIEITCSGKDAENFLHFNNGVTFICDAASFDSFQQTLTLERAQIVNGGQTVRALFRASHKGSLQPNVLVPARAITSSGDKDFANNVAVNQNNQNRVSTGFLRSNDKVVVQLEHALASLGWFLERREGELKSATEQERAAIEQRIGRSLNDHVISLKEGAQAYTATFYGQPELAKKNVKKIFLSSEDGGYFERIFSSEMTAEKIITSFEIKSTVDIFVRDYAAIRRKAKGPRHMIELMSNFLGNDAATNYKNTHHQMIPQCSLFLCGTLFKDLAEFRKIEPSKISAALRERQNYLIREHVLYILDYAENNRDKADRSWPGLMKSNTFYGHIISYIAGIRRGEIQK